MNSVQQELSLFFDEATEARARQICQGQEILGIGKTRIVIARGSNVLKLAWKEEGLRDNEVEYLLYQKASDELQELLCPTKSLLDDGSILQSRCQPLTFAQSGQEGRDLVSRLHRFGLSDCAVNIGRWEGRLVCYDYSLLSPDLIGRLLWESFYGQGD